MTLFDTGIRPVIDNWLLTKSKEKRDYQDYWSASQAGYCMRKVIFERLGVPPVEKDSDARKQRVYTSGHLFHEWIQGITKEAGLSIAQELELQDEDLMIRGHIDDLVLVGGGQEHPNCICPDLKIGAYSKQCPVHGKEIAFGDKNHMELAQEQSHLILYDYKTQNSRAFSYKRPMSYYHKMQLGTYMYMLRKGAVAEPTYQSMIADLTEARILKMDKDTLRMQEEQLMWNDELESIVKNYWQLLNNYWKLKKIPPCTCADHEGGFMAKEAWNPYFFNGKPCSIDYYNKWKLNKKEA